MENENKTKEQLMNELQELRQRIAELEASEAERRKAQEKLKESEEKHRVLFETSPDAIAQMDREGRFITSNLVMANRFGISVDELIGRRLFDVAPKEVAQRRMEFIRKAIDEGQIQIFEDARQGK
jgi:PAS domain-containing protein